MVVTTLTKLRKVEHLFQLGKKVSILKGRNEKTKRLTKLNNKNNDKMHLQKAVVN